MNKIFKLLSLYAVYEYVQFIYSMIACLHLSLRLSVSLSFTLPASLSLALSLSPFPLSIFIVLSIVVRV